MLLRWHLSRRAGLRRGFLVLVSPGGGPATGDAVVQILAAYTVKEELRSLLSLAGSNPERHLYLRALDGRLRVDHRACLACALHG
jgi:hypothetical protein